jgi:hypothetical protein
VIRYERSSLAVPPLSELQIGIAAGAVERDEEERLIAYIQTVSPIRSMQALNDRLGLTGFEMVSPDRYLSVDPNRPTYFQYENRITIPAGEEMPNLHTWSTVVLSINLRCYTLAEASGILVDGVFRGSFCTNMHYIDLERQESLSGSFEAHLA